MKNNKQGTAQKIILFVTALCIIVFLGLRTTHKKNVHVAYLGFADLHSLSFYGCEIYATSNKDLLSQLGRFKYLLAITVLSGGSALIFLTNRK